MADTFVTVNIWTGNERHGEPSRVRFKVGVPRDQPGPLGAVPPKTAAECGRKGDVMASFQLTDSQQVDVTAKFEDKRGNPVQLSGPPNWLVDNPNLLTLTPAPDGMSCTVAAAGPLGIGTLSVTAAGPGGDISGSMEIEVVSGAATQIELTAGTPTEQP